MTGSNIETSDLARMVKARLLPAGAVRIEADERERAALAARFAIVSVDALSAEIELELCKKGVRASGRLSARITQNCAVSGDPFPLAIEEPVVLRFIEEGTAALTPSDEDAIDFDLTAEDCDEIEYGGESFDLGEAVAQTLGLAIDPYAEGPGAETARAVAGIAQEGEADGPLAAGLAAGLAALKKN